MPQNDEIDSLVNKYSRSSSRDRISRNNSSRKSGNSRTNNTFLHQSTGSINYDHDTGEQMNFGLTRSNTTNTDAFPGDKYVMRRSKSKRDKLKKKKSKKEKSSRGASDFSKSTSSLMDGDSADELWDFTNSNNGDNSNSDKSARHGATRASVSPSYYVNGEITLEHVMQDRGSKYVLPPEPTEPKPETEGLLSSGMADPNDPLMPMMIDNYQDEFDDQMDEISMRDTKSRNFINLSELEAKKAANGRRSKTCRRCASWLLIFAVIVGGVAGVVVLIKSKKSDDKSVQKIQQEVPKVEDRLVGLWCKEGLDKGPGEKATFPLEPTEDCKKACNKAECCWNPNGNYECTPETRDNCLAYKHNCDIMIPHSTSDEAGDVNDDAAIPNDKEMVVPPAPSTLKTTCVPVGPSFIATKSCNDVCEKASCCWEENSTIECTAASFQANCAPYEEHCSFFNQHPYEGDNKDDLPFSVAASDLSTVCDVAEMEQIGTKKCQEKCKDASCCWKVGTVNCANAVPNHMCEPYAKACAVLNTVGENAVVNSNNNNNNNINVNNNGDGNNINIDNNNGGGNTHTNNNTPQTPRPAATPAPRPAPAPTSSASSSSSSSSVPEAPSGLDVYCDPSEMAEISLHICEDKCMKAECCWATGVDACPSSVPAETCQPYVKACAILNNLISRPGHASNNNNNNAGNSGGSSSSSNSSNNNNDNNNVPQAAGDFKTRCSKENIIESSDGGNILIQCERECLAASCCWQPGSELCTTNPRCLDYEEPCAMFVGLFSHDSDGTTTIGGDVPVAPSNLAETCSPNVLKPDVNNGRAIVECEKECLAAACCWKDTHDTTCPSDPNCSAYMEPCGNNLVTAIANLEGTASVTNGNNAQSPQAREIADACNNQVAFFVKTRCENACHAGDCCFDDTKTCGAGVDCGIYEPCRVLHRIRHNLRH